MNLGEGLTLLCEGAKSDVFLAAPFIKLHALRRLVTVIPPQVLVTVVVRFLPIDLAAGVTDYEIVEYLHARPNTNLRAHPVIHAKLYRVDRKVMIGSANISGRALGWHSMPNLELLLETNADNPIVREGEKEIIRTSYLLTTEIASSVRAAAATLSPAEQTEQSDGIETTGENQFWIPACMRPEVLWDVQTHGDVACATRRVVEAAKRDLSLLSVPAGLPKAAFEKIVQGLFKASPLYQKLSKVLSGSGLVDQDAAAWLTHEYGAYLAESPGDTWTTIKSWLRHFDSDEAYISADIERTRLGHIIG